MAGIYASDGSLNVTVVGGSAGASAPLTLESGTITSSDPALVITQTWNDSGTTFVGADMNITDTASDITSNLQQWRVNGAIIAYLRRDGKLVAGALDCGDGGLVGGSLYFSAAKDVAILKDGAANTLALRNSTNAQTFNIYNTYTDASNYERGFVKWASNTLDIGTAAAGTGSARDVRLLSQDGNVYSGVNNTGVFFGVPSGGTELYFRTTGLYPAVATSLGLSGSPWESLFISDYAQLTSGTAVSSLPGTPSVGMVARVTDADTPSIGSTVTGGASAAALVWYNGSNWTVIGV